MLVFLRLVLLIVLYGASIYVIYQFYSFIKCGCGKYGPFVSSYGKIKDDILDEARKVLKASKKPLKVTDLGCGSGALLLPLAREFPEHKFIGYEWDSVPLTMGKFKARGLKNISFIKGDYMKQSYKDMDLILCYVLKVTGEPLGKILAKDIKDSCVVISEMFPLGHLEEVKQIESSVYGVPEKIFIYKKPQAKKVKAVKETKAKAKSSVKVEKKADVEVKKPAKATKTKAETKKVEAKSVEKKVAPKALKTSRSKTATAKKTTKK